MSFRKQLTYIPSFRQGQAVPRVHSDAVHLAVLHVLRRLHWNVQQRLLFLCAILTVHDAHGGARGQAQQLTAAGQQAVQIDWAQIFLSVECVCVLGDAD